jgi:hypothetical protein
MFRGGGRRSLTEGYAVSSLGNWLLSIGYFLHSSYSSPVPLVELLNNLQSKCVTEKRLLLDASTPATCRAVGTAEADV